MKVVFDGISYLSLIASWVMLVRNLKRFKLQAYNLSVAKSDVIQKGSSKEVENAYLLLQTKIFLWVLPFFGICLACLFFGSAPTEIKGELPLSATIITCACFVISIIFGAVLFCYFRKTALKYSFMTKTNRYIDVRTRIGVAGTAFFIAIYQSWTLYFTVWVFMSNIGLI